MIIKQDLLKKIRSHFSLNMYEAKAWLALLSRGISTAGEVAEISGVPRSRTYDVLESLAKHGFAIEKLGKPVKYIAVKPTLIVEKLKNEAANELEERNKMILNLKNTREYSELEMLHKQGIEPIRPEEIIGAVKGRTNIHAQLSTLISNAKKSVVLATTTAALEKEMKLIKSLCARIQKKNISIKIAVNAKEDVVKNLSKELGLPVKPLNVDARFCISDGKEALFMLNESSDEDLGIWINSGFFASALQSLFDSAWQSR